MAAVPFPVVVCLSIFAAASETRPATVEITGNTFFSSSYLTAANDKAATSAQIEALIISILKKYTDAGFAFCRIYPETDSSERGSRKVVLKIDEGERITIVDYAFSSRGGTDAGALYRIARLRTKTLFSTRDITRAKTRLLRTGVFASIAEKIMKYEQGYYVVFELSENKNDYIAGSGSLAQDNFAYGVWLHSINIFGTMRRIQSAYESNYAEESARRRKLFLIDFTDPVILAPVEINARFGIATHDTAQLTELKGRFGTPLNDYMSTSLSTGIEAISYIADTTCSNQTHTILGIGFDLGYTARGWSTEQNLEFDYVLRAHNRSRMNYDGAFVVRSVHLRPHYWRVDTKQYDYFDHFRIGGSENIRGYLEEEFVVSQACWLNLEYKRYPVFPFVDVAWLKPGTGYMFSYGFGIDAITSFASASLVFAWPEKGTWYDGKVHFTLEKSL